MSITRERVLLRAKYGWPTETVPFNNGAVHAPDGYRTNGAGFVAMCWDLPNIGGGPSTVGLVKWVEEVPVRELLPGDAIGYFGPDSIDTDGGSAAIFEGWLNGDMNLGYALVWQQLPDATPGPARRARPVDFRKWHAYRLRDILD
jgi:hypothetical protein